MKGREEGGGHVRGGEVGVGEEGGGETVPHPAAVVIPQGAGKELAATATAAAAAGPGAAPLVPACQCDSEGGHSDRGRGCSCCLLSSAGLTAPLLGAWLPCPETFTFRVTWLDLAGLGWSLEMRGGKMSEGASFTGLVAHIK